MAATRLTDFNVETAIQDLQYVDPNLSLIQVALKDILSAKLGPVIDAMNSDFGLSIHKPAKYEIAPFEIGDAFIDSVLVSANIDTQAEAPRNFTNFSSIGVYVIGPRLHGPHQIEEMWHRAAAVRAVLYQFLNGYIDAQNRRLWGQLLPQPYQALPDEYANYSGVTVAFRGRHDPGHNAWRINP